MSEGGREGGGGGADTELKTKNPHVNAGKHVLVDVGQICRFFPVCTAFLLTRLVGVVTSCHFLSLHGSQIRWPSNLSPAGRQKR